MFKVYQLYLIKKFLLKFLTITGIFFSLVIILGVLEEISFFKNENINYLYPYFLTLLNAPITLFEIFPFIFLLTTQFFLYDLFKNDELILLKINGLSNMRLVKILIVLSVIIGVFNIVIYYNFASKLKFHYSNIKNSYSDDNKYLAMVSGSGLWIKDEINSTILITKSSSIKNNFLNNVTINEFNENFDLKRTIKSDKVNISDYTWKILEPKITIENNYKFSNGEIFLETNFNSEKINNFFSNISTLNILELYYLKDEFTRIGYSFVEIDLHLLKLYTMPLLYGLITTLSVVIMFNLANNKPLIFHIILGILLSVIIYYLNFIFNSMGINGNIPVILSIFLPIIFLTLISFIGLIRINEK